jgi:hypothetical protein
MNRKPRRYNALHTKPRLCRAALLGVGLGYLCAGLLALMT